MQKRLTPLNEKRMFGVLLCVFFILAGAVEAGSARRSLFS